MWGVLIWQIAVAVSVAVARCFSRGAMLAVALCWTIFTFVVVWAQALVVLQLATAWGTVGLLTLIVRNPKRTGMDSEDNRQEVPSSANSVSSSMVPGAASTAVPRKNDEPVKRLIDELLSFPGLRDDTRIDLNSYLLQFRSGRLQALDEKHVRDLYRRLQDPPATQGQPDSKPDGGQGAAARGGAPGAIDLFATISSIARGGGQAIDQWDRHVNLQLAKQKANAEIDVQLHRLRTSIERALEALDTVQRLRDDPNLAKYYQKLELLIRDDEPHTERIQQLVGLTLPPVERDRLPPQAVEQRRGWLEDALTKLEQAAVAVSRDAALMAELDERLATPVAAFIAGQRRLLKEHLAGLSPGERLPRITEASATGLDMFDPIRGTVNSSRPETSAQRADELPPVTIARDQSAVAAVTRQRHIPHLVHFTRCENLPSIFRHGLMSVSASGRTGLSVTRNDNSRWDGQLNGTSLSIAFPNFSMFFKYRQLSPGTDWAVLLIAPQVLWENDCAFYPHNAADGRMIRRPRDQMKSAAALSDMFADTEEGRAPSLRPCDPTDPQAEVMVYDVIEPQLIEAVAFETAAVRDRHRHLLEGRDSIWAGAGNGLFAARHHAITN